VTDRTISDGTASVAISPWRPSSAAATHPHHRDRDRGVRFCGANRGVVRPFRRDKLRSLRPMTSPPRLAVRTYATGTAAPRPVAPASTWVSSRQLPRGSCHCMCTYRSREFRDKIYRLSLLKPGSRQIQMQGRSSSDGPGRRGTNNNNIASSNAVIIIHIPDKDQILWTSEVQLQTNQEILSC
jgi:hypothetical protein